MHELDVNQDALREHCFVKMPMTMHVHHLMCILRIFRHVHMHPPCRAKHSFCRDGAECGLTPRKLELVFAALNSNALCFRMMFMDVRAEDIRQFAHMKGSACCFRVNFGLYSCSFTHRMVWGSSRVMRDTCHGLALRF